MCLVIDDLGKLGHVYREADVDAARFETVVADLLDGQYSDPLRVISFNTSEGWSQDISARVAVELRRRCDLEMRDIPAGLQNFLKLHQGEPHQLTLRLD